MFIPNCLHRRKLLLLVILILGCVTASVSCDRESQGAEITVLYYAGVPLGQMMREEIPAFTKATGIRVTYRELPYDAIRQREIASITNRQGTYDVIFVDDVWMSEYARKGYLVPLDSFVTVSKVDMNDFFESARRAEAVLDGRIWLMPQRADVQVLFYRTDLFQDPEHRRGFQQRFGRELRVPETWEEYREVTSYFTDYGRTSGRDLWGSGETLKRPHFAFEFFAMRYWSMTGQQFFSDRGEPLFDSAGGVRALEFMRSLAPIAAPGGANWAHDETISAFSQGQLAMAPQWYDFYATLRGDTTLPIRNRFGVAMVPGTRVSADSIRRTPSIGGGSLGIAADSRNKEAAWRFIEHMTGPDFMARAALRGVIVPRRSSYADPRVRQQNPAVDVYLQSLERAWFRPRLVEYAEIEAMIGRAVSRAYVGEAPPANALQEAANEARTRVGVRPGS